MGLRICLRFPWHASPRTSRRTSTQLLDMEENPFIIATTVRAKRLGRGIVVGSPKDEPLSLPILIRRTQARHSLHMNGDWKVSSTYSIGNTRKKLRSGDPTRHSYYSIPCHHAAALCAGTHCCCKFPYQGQPLQSMAVDARLWLQKNNFSFDGERTFYKKIMFSFFFLWKTKIQSPGLGSSTKPLRAITLHGLTCSHVAFVCMTTVYYVE